MYKALFNIFYSLAVIALCLSLGNLLNAYIGSLPGSLYGMVLFAFILKVRWVNPDRIKSTIQFMISHMGVCFVPAGVGIMNHFELLKAQGVTIVFIILFTTLLLISFIGLAHKYYLSKHEK